MSAESETGDLINNILSNICSTLNDSLNKAAHHSTATYCVRNKLRKKTRDLESGDIILPRGCLKLNEEECAQLLADVGSTKNPLISKVAQDRHYLVSLHLNRPAVYKAVILEVHKQGPKFGHHLGNPVGTVVLRTPPQKTKSLTDLRCNILHGHVKKLLEASGYTVQELKRESETDAKTQTENDLRAVDIGRMKKLAAADDDLWSVVSSGHAQQSPHPSWEEIGAEGTQVVLNLRKMAEKYHLVFGKDGLDKNLDKVVVMNGADPADVLKDVISLEHDIETSQQTEVVPNSMLHLVPQSQGFKVQQTLLVYYAISQNPVTQSYIVVGPVTAKARDEGTACHCMEDAEDFSRMRLEEVKEAFEMRNGSIEDSVATEKSLSEVHKASINMDVLQNAAHVPLHLDASSSEDSARTGAFVVYNTARLATLWSRFQQEVDAGTYPGLPAVADIDFSLLREKEEWELLYLYIARYPEVITQCTEVVSPVAGTLTAKVLTHKVANYLSSFSKCLSSYYSRYHILGGGEPHLLPRMYARLYLMKAAHQVLLNALRTMDVQALDFL